MPAFLDNLLAPFRRRSAPAQTTLGASGNTVFGGFLERDESSAALQGQQRYITYSNILANTSIVAAGARYFLNLVSRAGWKVEPADDSAQAQEIAELIDAMMHDMTTPWHRVVRRAAMFRFYGFSVQEWTAKRRDDNRLGMLDVEARPQRTIERWDLDITGTVHGVVQRVPQTQAEVYLPRPKLVYFVDDTLDDSPEGMGLFRHLVESNKRLQRYLQLEGFGFETDLHGIPIGRAPLGSLDDQVTAGTINPQDRANQLFPITEFLQHHIKDPAKGPLGIILDSMVYETKDEAGRPSNQRKWDLELLGTDGQSSLETVAGAIERLNREMARVLGVEFLMLGGDGKGSLALSRDKTQQFGVAVETTLTDLKEGFQGDFIGPLMRLNGWPEEMEPQLKTDSVQFRDIEQITGALVDLATSGAVLPPDDPAINEVRDLLGLSRQPEDMQVVLAEERSLGIQALGESAGGPGGSPEDDDVDVGETEDDG